MKISKLIAIIMAMLVLVGMFGCSSGTKGTESSSTVMSTISNESATVAETSAAKEKKTIEFWMLPLVDESKIKAMIDEFNSQSEMTQVNLTVLAWTDGREQIKQAVAAGTGPDVFYLGAGLDASLVDAGLILPLDENGYSDDDIAKYSSLIGASMVNNHLYAAPISYETYIMYYRTDILKQFGFADIPTTWDKLKEMAAKITKESNGSIMGFQFKGADDQLNAINFSWQAMLSEFGGDLMDLNTMTSVESSEAGNKALEFMKSFYSEDISDFGTSANAAFREGALAMYCFTNGPLTSEGFATDKELEGKWTVGPMPGNSGYIGGHAVCASAATKNAENCIEFMKWFTSPENASTWMTAFFGICPYEFDKLSEEQQTSINSIYESNPVIWTALNEAASKSDVDMFGQSRYGYTARWDAQKRLIISALNGETSVEDALKQIDAEVNQSL